MRLIIYIYHILMHIFRFVNFYQIKIIVLGKYGVRWSILLNAPFVILPFYAGFKFLKAKSSHIKKVSGMEKKREFNGTSTHLLDGYISANQRFFLHSCVRSRSIIAYLYSVTLCKLFSSFLFVYKCVFRS